MFSGLPTFEVDFHEAEDNMPLLVSPADAVAGLGLLRLHRGAPIQLWDPESGYCLGRIERMRSGDYVVSLDWRTWAPAPVVDLMPVYDITTAPDWGGVSAGFIGSYVPAVP